jgi:hypothetical protein
MPDEKIRSGALLHRLIVIIAAGTKMEGAAALSKLRRWRYPDQRASSGAIRADKHDVRQPPSLGASRWCMSKSAIIGQVVSLIGAALWVFGYFATGHRPVIDWQAHAPSWIADFLPNLESEIGMVVCLGGMIATYWPRSRE